MLCSGGKDYEITENYRGTKKRRIQACHITKKQIAHNKVGERYENCQRIDTLRFLVSPELLELQETLEENRNFSEQIVSSLQASYKNQSKIPRLLQSPLSIEEVYTDLVLLEQNKEEKKADEFLFKEQRINSWEDVQGSKKTIELTDLFDNKKKAYNRLLILGRAGIGKSILCQYIAHQWAEGKLWKDKFDALFWIPLRKLQHAHSAETLSSFLFRLCCQEYGKTLYLKDVTDYLRKNQERILFVLDGLDEVSPGENIVQETILKELLQLPYWILTSRPHAAGSICADATIENVGFASKTIDAYVKKSFPKNPQAMVQKVRQNPIIFGLCHIPINLELVCSILQRSKGDISAIRSMTGLYEELTLILQKRFLEKLGKPSAWHWGPEDVESDPEASLIFKLLESIAWEGMKEKALFFSFKQGAMRKIYYNSFPSFEADNREPFFKKICTSGFLQSTGDSDLFLQNDYCFLHLTFQEYFAARYLARLLQDKPQEAAKCIQEVKLNARYKVVMWFVSGLLRNEGGEWFLLNTFFDLLDTSKDLIGFYDSTLKIRCLEECEWQKGLQKIETYKKEIQFWVERTQFQDSDCRMKKYLLDAFEISLQGAKLLLIPRLISCLSKSKYPFNLLEALEPVAQADPKAVIPALIEALKDKDWRARKIAAKTLGQIGYADPKTVSLALFQAFKDEYRDVREAVVKALVQIGYTDPKTVIPALIEALKNEDKNIRLAAAKVLGLVIQVDPLTIISAFIQALKDTDWEIRQTIEKAFDQIGQVEIKNVFSLLIGALKNEDRSVRKIITKGLGQIGKVDPQTIIPGLIQALGHEDTKVKEAAVEAIDQISQADPLSAIPALIQALNHKNTKVIIVAIKALGKIGQVDYKIVVSALLQLLKYKDEQVIIVAIEALGKIGQADYKIVIPPLLQLLKYKDKQVIIAAVEALGKIGQADSTTVIPTLIQAFKHKGKIKIAAASALGKLGQTDFIFFLLSQALKEKNYYDLKDFLNKATIEKLGQNNLKPIISALIQALKDENHEIKQFAAYMLGEIGQADPTVVLPVLFQVCKNKVDFQSDAFSAIHKIISQADPKSAIPILIQALKDEDHEIKRFAAHMLGQIGHADPKIVIPALFQACKNKVDFQSDAFGAIHKIISQVDPKSAIPELIQALKDEDHEIKQFAAYMLGQIGHADPKIVIPALFQACKNKNDAFGVIHKVIQTNSKSAIPELIQALKDEDWEIIQFAIYCLGEVGQADPEIVIPALMQVLKHDNEKFREIAARSLTQISDLQNFTFALNHLDDGEIWIRRIAEYILFNMDYTALSLNSFINCYENNFSESSIFSAVIAQKCIEGNLPLFQEGKFLCFYEQSKLCKVDTSNANAFKIQIENLISGVPKFSSNALIKFVQRSSRDTFKSFKAQFYQ